MSDNRCRYSGLSILSCKVSDLCDCFDYPEADERALQILKERDARAASTIERTGVDDQ